jgi:PleD family two-component response regulator
MPSLDGLKFIRRIRLTERTKEVPVLIISSVRDVDSVYQAKELGVSGYVVKPIEPEELLKRVQAAID